MWIYQPLSLSFHHNTDLPRRVDYCEFRLPNRLAAAEATRPTGRA
jgi:hypothetical protein